MTSRRIAAVLTATVLATVAVFAAKLWVDAGELRTIEPFGPGDCRGVGPIAGPEDILMLPGTSLAFISSDSRSGERSRRGAIYAYDVAAPGSALIDLTARLPFEFHPHGISHFRDARGRDYLYVVNHRTDGDTVEIMRYHDHRLDPIRTVRGALLKHANDLVAVAPMRFYVTTDHRYDSRLGQAFEDYTRAPTGRVLYFDGNGFTAVAHGIPFANGINASPDGTRLYVASMLGKRLLVYTRATDEDLRLIRELPLDAGPDNIDVDADGRLLVAAHEKLVTLARHRRDPRIPAPSSVTAITPSPAGTFELEEVYRDDGRQLAAASVAVRRGRVLLIGAIYDDHILVCGV